MAAVALGSDYSHHVMTFIWVLNVSSLSEAEGVYSEAQTLFMTIKVYRIHEADKSKNRL